MSDDRQKKLKDEYEQLLKDFLNKGYTAQQVVNTVTPTTAAGSIIGTGLAQTPVYGSQIGGWYQNWPYVEPYKDKYEQLTKLLPQMIALLIIIDRVIDHADETTKSEFRTLQDDLYKTTKEIIDQRT